MSGASFHEKLVAHRAHLATVPGALGEAKAALSSEPQSVTVFAETLRTLVHEVERLQERERQLLREAREEQREFQREARDIAAEAHWRGAQGDEYGSY